MVQTLLNDMHSQQLQKYNDEAHSIYDWITGILP